jgi:hypothetical protein
MRLGENEGEQRHERALEPWAQHRAAVPRLQRETTVSGVAGGGFIVLVAHFVLTQRILDRFVSSRRDVHVGACVLAALIAQRILLQHPGALRRVAFATESLLGIPGALWQGLTGTARHFLGGASR